MSAARDYLAAVAEHDGDVWADHVEASRADLTRMLVDLVASTGSVIEEHTLQHHAVAVAQAVKLLSEILELRRAGEIPWK